MKLESKFRKLYFGKFIFLHIVALFVICLLINIGLSIDELGLMIFFIIIVIAMTFSISIGFYNISKITIDQNGILNEAIFLKTKTFISFSKIKNFKSEISRNRKEVVSHQIKIEVDNDMVLIITPDCYDNYDEIKLLLRKALDEYKHEA